MTAGPRIYNLFPSLVGPVAAWAERLADIQAMNFNWIFLNPFHLPGASGSLYAVKDYYRLNPLFQGDDDRDAELVLRGFLQQAHSAGTAVMMDLVINHTAKDSPLVTEHREWFIHDADGSIRSPSAVHPDNPEDITIWEDLAAIDYAHPKDRNGLLRYWTELVTYYTRLGFRGFRCDAAYQVPGDVWREIIDAARQVNSETRFFAETLGAQPNQIEQLRGAGFDYFFNSVKWWDFRKEWLLDQYQRLRPIAPSIGFPESHDTARLAMETGGDERQSRLWYLFTAFFSSGVMMPIGYEYGFRRELNVVMTRPEDREEPSFDLTHFVCETNRMKAETPVLNEEGPQQRFTTADVPLVGLLRRSEDAIQRAAILINPGEESCLFSASQLAEAMETKRANVREITPFAEGKSLPMEAIISMEPYGVRVYLTDDG